MLETNPSSFLCLAFAHVSLVLLCEEKALKFAGLATMLQLPSFLPSPPRIIKLPAPPAPGPATLPTLLLPQRFGAAAAAASDDDDGSVAAAADAAVRAELSTRQLELCPSVSQRRHPSASMEGEGTTGPPPRAAGGQA